MRAFVIAALVCVPSLATAQTSTVDDTSFSIDRYTAAPGPGVYLAVEDPEVMRHLAWSMSLNTSLLSRPLVLQNVLDEREVTTPVSKRLGFELAGALGLGRRYQVGAVLPIVAAQTGDRLQNIGLGDTELRTTTIGDLRLHGKARFAGDHGDPGFGAGLSAAITLPTGDGGHFAGEAGAVIEWRLIFGYRKRL